MKNKLYFKSLLMTFFLLFCSQVNAEEQITDTIVMISPDTFQFNEQAAVTNKFQQSVGKKESDNPMQEFNQMVALLKTHNINVITLSSVENIITPDAVFPNNWFSTHQQSDGTSLLTLYPMLNKNRQAERGNLDKLKIALKKNNINLSNILDFSYYEKSGKAMEGTGSMILDREHKVAFISLSPRADLELAKEITSKLGYKLVTFTSFDRNDQQIYHTNVLMSIGSKFAVVCDQCIKNDKERSMVIAELKALNKEVITITPEQVHKMAGNILQLGSTKKDISKIVMSKTAYDAFTPSQKNTLGKYGDLVIVNIPFIEKVGGGSARCMIAEIF
jgi:hypothetical protein